jgi:formate C-acetyltransferase
MIQETRLHQKTSTEADPPNAARPLNERIARLREESVTTRPYLSTERAELITRFYQGPVPRQCSPPVTRAKAFLHLMEEKTIFIGPEELIVGERGPAPKATPTYPELCCHSLSDLEILHTRERTPFTVSEETRTTYRDTIIPFWQGATQRDQVFQAMRREWHDAFEAGVFTEFMEQRAPGHAICDDKIYRHGFLDVRHRIARQLDELDWLNDLAAWDKREELIAMDLCCQAIIRQAERYADRASELAAEEEDPDRRRELLEIAEICRHVPAHAPRTFREALQCYWFVHLGVITELNTWDSFNPGRLDQHLYPFYRREIEAGTLTREKAKELLECFWIKFNNQPAPPKVGITEEQSGTYTDFALINIGGLTPEGHDAVNDVSYLLLEVVQEMQLVQPSACIQLSKKNPDAFLRAAGEVIRTGLGQPSVFNSDVIVQEMLHDGKTLHDARCGGPSGCVTVSAFGKESCTLTGYFNWPKVLELALHDGVDPRTGKQIGPKTGDPTSWNSFDELVSAYRTQLRYFVDLKIEGNHLIERLYATRLPAPFMSLLMDDCVATATDYHAGGSRYNPTYIQGVGLGTTTDAMAALEHLVFREKSLSMPELLDALRTDFEDREPLRQTLMNKAPKWGNDDPRADRIARDLFEIYFEAIDGRPNTKGGKYRVNLLPTTVHIYFGEVLGASANGRRAGVPLSEGISPTQGADLQGPTAVVQSAARIDHARTGGTLLNMKFHRHVLDGEGLDRLGSLVRGYFRMDGHHIQFNVVDASLLRRAKAEPEKYRNLIVRVAGYSDYFVELGSDLQDEIISRTEHRSFGAAS